MVVQIYHIAQYLVCSSTVWRVREQPRAVYSKYLSKNKETNSSKEIVHIHTRISLYLRV